MLISPPHYNFLCIKNILAALVHERAKAIALGEGVIKYSSMTHNVTETGGLGPHLTHKYILFKHLHGASENVAEVRS